MTHDSALLVADRRHLFRVLLRSPELTGVTARLDDVTAMYMASVLNAVYKSGAAEVVISGRVWDDYAAANGTFQIGKLPHCTCHYCQSPDANCQGK